MKSFVQVDDVFEMEDSDMEQLLDVLADIPELTVCKYPFRLCVYV